MKFYISTSGIKRVTISNGGGGSGGGSPATVATAAVTRRLSHRTLLPAVLILGIILPFLFVRIAFVVLESATVCSSTLDCIGWSFFGGSGASMKLREELSRTLVEVNKGEALDGRGIEGVPSSFNDLVNDITTNRHDLKVFAFKTKAMLVKMEHKVRSAKKHESIYWHLASHGVPKSLHCLCLKLAEEYAINAMARSRLPSPEFVSRLSDPSFNHIILLTDNVLAASVVISSTIANSANPENLVFHIVTDKKSYTPMHAWFATYSIELAVVEVKGLHQYDWSHDVNVGVKEMLEIHRLIWRRYYHNFKENDFELEGEHERNIEALQPSCLSLMNHLRIYIPELFPDLKKIVFLDDDVVVQHDLSPLWELDLDGKVVGAVADSWCADNEMNGCCLGRKYEDYFNFSNPIISSNLDSDRCGWLYGMNVFDLQAWRTTNITATYHHWLKLSLDSGMVLWHPGALPPALIAFDGFVQPIDPLWHMSGLGYQIPENNIELLDSAAVVHFSGPAKPWLEIGFPEVRSLWTKYVNFSNKFIRKCRFIG